ncbi:YggT family protein [Gemella sp. GL1.1]|nr:YggT family protein [Gemella sp. GL1.1]MBF0747216.1 YggT family protein [Gemella sp. 19428wG2_WT2a]NYS27883.1 YggT family protein [Gemella sp. GL1]TFU58023.1 YggT family protein [Gemella sp. WT2a]
MNFIVYSFTFYRFAIIIYILSSWFPMARDNFIIKFLADICEPYLSLFRKIIPSLASLDFSPIIAILALDFVQRTLVSFLMQNLL